MFELLRVAQVAARHWHAIPSSPCFAAARVRIVTLIVGVSEGTPQVPVVFGPSAETHCACTRCPAAAVYLLALRPALLLGLLSYHLFLPLRALFALVLPPAHTAVLIETRHPCLSVAWLPSPSAAPRFHLPVLHHTFMHLWFLVFGYFFVPSDNMLCLVTTKRDVLGTHAQ